MNIKPNLPATLMRFTVTAIAAMTLAACQTTPPVNADLAAARSTLDRARNNTFVAKSGAVELDRAQQAMARADAAWTTDRDTDQTRHLAYLARQRAEIALAVGSQAESDARVQQAGAERERVKLDARSAEADRANATARTAQGEARVAKNDAMLSRNQADVARAQADSAQVQAGEQTNRADSLERDLLALQGRSTDRGMVVTLGDVLFDTGRATMQPGAQRSVEQLAQVLRQHPERRVLIEGFTDSVGSEQTNLQLSQRRAEGFAQMLVNGGIAADRIQVHAWGKANPVASNRTAAGRQQNRRVEVLFSDAEGRIAAR
jgi:outer membrane protein OmpA-like peptidoglycan-associated protein